MTSRPGKPKSDVLRVTRRRPNVAVTCSASPRCVPAPTPRRPRVALVRKRRGLPPREAPPHVALARPVPGTRFASAAEGSSPLGDSFCCAGPGGLPLPASGEGHAARRGWDRLLSGDSSRGDGLGMPSPESSAEALAKADAGEGGRRRPAGEALSFARRAGVWSRMMTISAQTSGESRTRSRNVGLGRLIFSFFCSRRVTLTSPAPDDLSEPRLGRTLSRETATGARGGIGRYLEPEDLRQALEYAA
jgi:hypothetical protein